VLDAGRNRLEARRSHTLDDFVRDSRRGYIDLQNRYLQQSIANGAAYCARLFAVAVKHGQ
jgi:hypothetical protein